MYVCVCVEDCHGDRITYLEIDGRMKAEARAMRIFSPAVINEKAEVREGTDIYVAVKQSILKFDQPLDRKTERVRKGGVIKYNIYAHPCYIRI